VNRTDQVGRAPWDTGELVRLIAGVAVGAAVFTIAWVGASGHAELKDQTGWLAVGVTGFFLAVAGQGLWIVRGRRALAARAARVMGEVAALAPASAGATRPARVVEQLVAADGMRRYHRPECPIASGRGWSPLPRPAHESAGRTPCGICQP
jgi:hypothetical protein